MEDIDIKEICEKVSNQYASKIKGDDSIAEMLRNNISLISRMTADILVEYNRASGEQRHQQ